MPKRVIDDAIWTSDKLSRCRPESVPEYTWLYMLADAFGNFELNTRIIHSKAYVPLRPFVTEIQVKGFLADFEKNGLLYTWSENGKRYGHWTGSEKQGRLPPYVHRSRYAGNLNVKALYEKNTDKPVDEGLIEYLERTANPEPEPQIHLPMRSEQAHLLRKEAEKNVDQAQAPIVDTAEFQKFKKLYPPVGWVHEIYTRQQFANLSRDPLVIDKLFEGLSRHIKSHSWQQGFIVNCDRFLDDRYWEKPPRETANGQRPIGPAGRTTEEHIERNQKIDRAFRRRDK